MLTSGHAYHYRSTGDGAMHVVRVTGRRRNMRSPRGLTVYRCDVLVLDTEGRESGVQRIPLSVGEEGLTQRAEEYDR